MERKNFGRRMIQGTTTWAAVDSKRDGWEAVIPCISAPGHHLEKETSQIFGFRNGRQSRMIRRLPEPEQTARGATRVHKRIGDCFQKCGIIHMMRAGERRQQTIFR